MHAAAPSLAGVQIFSPDDAMSTMRLMGRKVTAALKDPYVVHRANEIIAAAPSRDYPAQIEALRTFADNFFYFVDNPVGLQRVQSPRAMLDDIDRRQMAQGACDDAATLLATLGMADALPARFVAYAFGQATGNPVHDRAAPFTHVICHLFDGHDWVMLDVTRPEEIHRLPDVLRTLTLDL